MISLISNSFVDRDMLMRFRGGGVGHRTTREATNIFLDDRDPLDQPILLYRYIQTGLLAQKSDTSSTLIIHCPG
jgi:hypothetical protein